ncbi:MAG: hypothetical protein M3P51_06800, partial [Chloroflexota bacterium]|nr:hypothetical protein [Chloroflexota bacterium]
MDYRLLGFPNISPQGFAAVLSRYGAPQAVRDVAHTLYRDAMEYGVDPLVSLGFGLHEHGLRWIGVAGKTLGFGNLRPGSSWAGRVYANSTGQFYESSSAAQRAGATDLFRAYGSYREGYRDFCRLLRVYSREWGLETVSEAIPVYAPASDNNDVAAYISSVNGACEAWQARYGGVMEIIPTGGKATTRTTVNVRSGPGVGYDKTQELAAGVEVQYAAYTTQGVTYTADGVSSSAWLLLPSGGWITAHRSHVDWTPPPTVADLQVMVADRNAMLSLAQREIE